MHESCRTRTHIHVLQTRRGLQAGGGRGGGGEKTRQGSKCAQRTRLTLKERGGGYFGGTNHFNLAIFKKSYGTNHNLFMEYVTESYVEFVTQSSGSSDEVESMSEGESLSLPTAHTKRQVRL